MKTNEWLLQNAIKIAVHHKQYCEEEDCTISLFGLADLLEKAGIKLTKEQREEFL